MKENLHPHISPRHLFRPRNNRQATIRITGTKKPPNKWTQRVSPLRRLSLDKQVRRIKGTIASRPTMGVSIASELVTHGRKVSPLSGRSSLTAPLWRRTTAEKGCRNQQYVGSAYHTIGYRSHCLSRERRSRYSRSSTDTHRAHAEYGLRIVRREIEIISSHIVWGEHQHSWQPSCANRKRQQLISTFAQMTTAQSPFARRSYLELQRSCH